MGATACGFATDAVEARDGMGRGPVELEPVGGGRKVCWKFADSVRRMHQLVYACLYEEVTARQWDEQFLVGRW